MLPFAFEPGMGFERYVDYALDVPMYFVKRGPVYHDVAGASFRDLLDGRLAALPGERATLSDWANHLSTIFPEVRLKRYLEMRGADVGPPERIVALAALMVGLYYDPQSLAGAGDLIKGWSAEERQKLARRGAAPCACARASAGAACRRSPATRCRSRAPGSSAARGSMRGVATRQLISIRSMRSSLRDARPRRTGSTKFEGPWQRSVEPAFREALL